MGCASDRNFIKGAMQKATITGLGAASTAYLIWGLSPIYWKSLSAVPAFEILMHRMIWSFVFYFR